MVRAVGGANYFFFDWLGLGGQVGYSLGNLDYDTTFTGSHTYAVFDFGGGVEFQFYDLIRTLGSPRSASPR